MKILIAGDYCPQERVADLIKTGRGLFVMEEVKPYLENVDYSIVNFECVIADKEDHPIVKYGPCLSCTNSGVDLLKQVGFNCVALANNHFRDYGDVGVKKTLRSLKELGIDYVGGGVNIYEAERILFKEIQGRTIAFVNFCENEFSIATKHRCGSAAMNAVVNYQQISEAKQKADLVIVIVHGGHEGYQYPTPRMKQLYEWYIDLGANAVINGHQHCYSGYEIYKGAPIFYGLGNFCFDEHGCRDDIWNFGYFVVLTFDEDLTIHFECVPYEQCNAKPSVRLLRGSDLKEFHQILDRINSVITNEESFEAQDKEFRKSKSDYLSCLAPYMNEYARVAVGRGWLPLLIPQKQLLNILNFIRCESHRDLLVDSIENKIYHDEEDN